MCGSIGGEDEVGRGVVDPLDAVGTLGADICSEVVLQLVLVEQVKTAEVDFIEYDFLCIGVGVAVGGFFDLSVLLRW